MRDDKVFKPVGALECFKDLAGNSWHMVKDKGLLSAVVGLSQLSSEVGRSVFVNNVINGEQYSIPIEYNPSLDNEVARRVAGAHMTAFLILADHVDFHHHIERWETKTIPEYVKASRQAFGDHFSKESLVKLTSIMRYVERSSGTNLWRSMGKVFSRHAERLIVLNMLLSSRRLDEEAFVHGLEGEIADMFEFSRRDTEKCVQSIWPDKLDMIYDLWRELDDCQ